jgi:hypothetical protein
MPRECRISVRLPEVQMDCVQKFCKDTGHDISHVVRQALDAFLAPKSGTALNSGPPKRTTPPETVFDMVPQYLNHCDLRGERKRLFAHLLAISFVAKKHWARTPGVVEAYEPLLQLCRYFGFE